MSDFIFPGGFKSIHPILKARRKRQADFEAPGARTPNLANKLSAQRKAAREVEAEIWLAEVKSRKAAK